MGSLSDSFWGEAVSNQAMAGKGNHNPLASPLSNEWLTGSPISVLAKGFTPQCQPLGVGARRVVCFDRPVAYG